MLTRIMQFPFAQKITLCALSPEGLSEQWNGPLPGRVNYR